MNKPTFRARKLTLIIVIFIVIVSTLIFVSCNNKSYIDNNSLPSDLLSGSPDKLPEEDEVKKLLEGMDIDEKIGQMVIGGYENINEILPIISENKLGGVILFQKNISSVSQTIKDSNTLKMSNGQNKIPIFLSVDQEGGKVNRLPGEMGS